MHSIQKNIFSIQKAESSKLIKKVTFYNAKFGQNYSDEREPLIRINQTQTKVNWDKTD